MTRKDMTLMGDLSVFDLALLHPETNPFALILTATVTALLCFFYFVHFFSWKTLLSPGTPFPIESRASLRREEKIPHHKWIWQGRNEDSAPQWAKIKWSQAQKEPSPVQ